MVGLGQNEEERSPSRMKTRTKISVTTSSTIVRAN